MITNLSKSLLSIKSELSQLTHNKQQIMYESVKDRLNKTLESYEHDVSLVSDKLTRRYINRL